MYEYFLTDFLHLLSTLFYCFHRYGFNCVSMPLIDEISVDRGADNAYVVSKIAINTTLSAAVAALTSIGIGVIHLGYTDVDLAAMGILAGLVSITGGCSVVEPEAAMFIGFVGSIVFYAASQLLLKYHIDDVLNASPVHLFCGFWGLIATGLFATQENYKMAINDYGDDTPCGLFYGCGPNQLFANLIFGLAAMAWTGFNALVVFGVLGCVGALRVPVDDEINGMDMIHHGGMDNPELIALYNRKFDRKCIC